MGEHRRTYKKHFAFEFCLTLNRRCIQSWKLLITLHTRPPFFFRSSGISPASWSGGADDYFHNGEMGNSHDDITIWVIGAGGALRGNGEK